MSKYVIGLDFGTESGRAVLVEVTTGRMIATHVTKYPHGVINKQLPTGELLEQDWALQHPNDYIYVVHESIPSVLQQSGVEAADVIGVGVDCTSSTILPVDSEGGPLCLKSEFQHRPHSWPKLWKHHAAKVEATDITEIAKNRSENFIKRYGGKISSEWMIPKILQVLREDPQMYAQADLFVEAGDWIVFSLTGSLTRNVGGAGFKAMWGGIDRGYPSREYFRELHPAMEDVVTTKLRGSVVSPGAAVGGISEEMSRITGLLAGTPVAAAIIDAFAAVPAAGATKPGTMVMAMGTSTCHLVLGEQEIYIEGMTGVVKDGILPGYYGYEAGQAAVGDIFAWFIENCVPDYILQDANQKGISLFRWFDQKASQYQPGETGLLALDWWNGNRSILMDARLTGLIIGYTLATTPVEVYRTLIEATAFGTRRIAEQVQESGIHITYIYAMGGLPKRNPMLMQIYADVLGREIHVPNVEEGTAVGAAMYGAVAAGKEGGGYETMTEAVERMSSKDIDIYVPIPSNVQKYEELYRLYCHLYDHFGHDDNLLMHHLRDLKEKCVVTGRQK